MQFSKIKSYIPLVLLLVLCVGTLFYVAALLINIVIMRAYHENVFDGLFASHYWWIFVSLLFVNLVSIITYYVRKNNRRGRIALVGIGIGVGIIGMQFLTNFVQLPVEREYRIGEAAYLIPWQYNPSWDATLEGPQDVNSISITLTYPDMKPKYHRGYFLEPNSPTLTLRKSELSETYNPAYSQEENESCLLADVKEKDCTRRPSYFYFREEGFEYTIFSRELYEERPFSTTEEIHEFQDLIISIFKSFKTQ